MVPVMGRLVAHGTCHRVKACKNVRGPLEVKQGDPPTLAGHMHAALT